MPTSTTRSAQPGEVVSTGGALLSERVTDFLNNARSAALAANPAAAQALKPVFSLPKLPETNTPPAQTSTPPVIDNPTVGKRSSSVYATNPTQTSVNPLSELTSTVEARTVDTVAVSAVTFTEPARTTLQRTGFTIEPTTAAMMPSAVTTQSTEPVMMAASETTTAQPQDTNLLATTLSIFGIGVNPAGSPVGGSPVALALLAVGSRRESEETFSEQAKTTTTSTPVAAAALTGAAPTAAATTDPYPASTNPIKAISPNTDFIEYVTGPGGSLNNTTTRFNIGGTDVGTMWDNGIKDNPNTAVNEHQVLIAFGDTFGKRYPVRTGFWRMNTLLRSPDNTLNNGMYVPNTVKDDRYSGSSTIAPLGTDPKEIVDRNNIKGYVVGQEVTIIPTAGISVTDSSGHTRQYVNFMSVRSWDTPGRWTTNYSGIAYSDDNGQTWTSRRLEHPSRGGGSVDQAVCQRKPELPAGCLCQGRASRCRRKARVRRERASSRRTVTSTRTALLPAARVRRICRAWQMPTFSTRPSTSTGTAAPG